MTSTIEFLSFQDWIRSQEHKKEDWIIVARCRRNEVEDFRTVSVLAAEADDHLERLLSEHHWEIGRAGGLMGFGKPSFDLEGENLIYHSGQSVDINGIVFQPFTIFRSHPLNHELVAVKLVQNFILYHDAFLVREEKEYHRVNENGEIEIVARINNEKNDLFISVYAPMLRDYLAANKSHLVRYHDHRRNSQDDIGTSLSDGYQKRIVSGDLYRFKLCIVSPAVDFQPQYRSRSTLLGKDIVLPYPHPLDYHRHEITGANDEKYAEFIVGLDDRGGELKATCNKEELSSRFVGRGTAHYLTPVFFKKDVLAKYYREPSRFQVGKVYVSCLTKWSLEIDETDEGLVRAYLGDLGNIPYNEQLYWSTFNVVPRGGISQERFQRDFLNEPIEPVDDPVYHFKKAFELLQGESMKRFREPIFLHLTEDDAHRYSSLRMPLNEEWNELEEQIESLAIITSDSINVRLLKRLIGASVGGLNQKKPIELLEVYLDTQSISASDKTGILGGLRMVQALRSSGASHRKGSRFDGVMKKHKLGNLSKADMMKRVFFEITRSLTKLRVAVQNTSSL